MIDRETAMEYVGYVVDDAGAGRKIGDDPHAIVRDRDTSRYPSVLVGWQCGFEAMFVAVHSYLDVELEDWEAEEMAREYLEEIGWFGERHEHDENDHHADWIIR